MFSLCFPESDKITVTGTYCLKMVKREIVSIEKDIEDERKGFCKSLKYRKSNYYNIKIRIDK